MGLFDWVQTGIQWLQDNWTQPTVGGGEEPPPPIPARRIILIGRRKGPPPDWRRYRKPMHPRDVEMLVEDVIHIQPRSRSLVFVEVETDIFDWLPVRPRYKVLGLTASPRPASRITAHVVCRQSEIAVDGEVEGTGYRVSSLDTFLRLPTFQLDQEVGWLHYGIIANGPRPQTVSFASTIDAETEDSEALSLLLHMLDEEMPVAAGALLQQEDAETFSLLLHMLDEEMPVANVIAEQLIP